MWKGMKGMKGKGKGKGFGKFDMMMMGGMGDMGMMNMMGSMGMGMGKPGPAPTSGLEAQFTAKLKSFDDEVLNLNVTAHEIQQKFEALMVMRAELAAVAPGAVLSAGPPAPAFPMGGMGGMGAMMGGMGGMAAGVIDEKTNWKGLLQQVMGKWLKRVLQPGDLEYVTDVVDPENPTKGGYTCTLTCNCVEQQGTDQAPKFPGRPMPSKKMAEQEAAMQAFADLFPEQMPAAAGGAPFQAQGPPTKKRKLEAATEDPKAMLLKGVQCLKEQPLAKGDITYDVQGPDGEGMYQATCVLANVEGAAQYVGERNQSKKLAEMSAAEAAYRAMESVIAPKLAEKEEKKKAQNAEKLAQLKEQMQAKKEAKKAEKAAAPPA